MNERPHAKVVIGDHEIEILEHTTLPELLARLKEFGITFEGNEE